jgi:hypothetical protein
LRLRCFLVRFATVLCLLLTGIGKSRSSLVLVFFDEGRSFDEVGSEIRNGKALSSRFLKLIVVRFTLTCLRVAASLTTTSMTDVKMAKTTPGLATAHVYSVSMCKTNAVLIPIDSWLCRVSVGLMVALFVKVRAERVIKPTAVSSNAASFLCMYELIVFVILFAKTSAVGFLAVVPKVVVIEMMLLREVKLIVVIICLKTVLAIKQASVTIKFAKFKATTSLTCVIPTRVSTTTKHITRFVIIAGRCYCRGSAVATEKTAAATTTTSIFTAAATARFTIATAASTSFAGTRVTTALSFGIVVVALTFGIAVGRLKRRITAFRLAVVGGGLQAALLPACCFGRATAAAGGSGSRRGRRCALGTSP